MQYPNIDPVALSIGPLSVHWYGLMYLFGFLGAWLLGRGRAEKAGWTAQEVEDLLFYGAVGVIIGGRLGSTLFYNFAHIAAHPIDFFKIWQGGMSFHGGLIGVGVAFILFARKTGRSYWQISDFTMPMVPIGLFFGRIGNFINGELWGRATDMPWGMAFPTGGDIIRHPSQLYEAGLEGLILFLILLAYSRSSRPAGAITGVFLLGYGVFRSFIELYRVPDVQYGYFAFDWLTMGQILSLPMILLGSFFIWRAYARN